MRLALVTQHFPPHFEGGTEAVVRAQARAFAARGAEVLVVAGSDRPWSGVDVERSRLDGFAVAHLARHPSEPYDLFLERPRLRALVEELTADFDLVHLHHWSTLDRRLVRTLARRLPVVVTLHDLFVTCPRFFRVPEHGVPACGEPGDLAPCVACVGPDLPTVAAADLLDGLASRAEHFAQELAAAALVVAPSAAHLERLRAHVPLAGERALVLAHGLTQPLGDVSGVVRDLGERLVVGSLGHRARVKGSLDLAHAVAGLPAELRRRVTLVFFGEELERGLDDELRALARRAEQEGGGFELRLEPAYRLEELAARVRAVGGLHLTAQPSRAFESYGLVVDEALALGLSVWVSDRGAPRERVGAAGRVLPAADPAAWTRALAEALADPGSLARERAAVPARVPTAEDASLALSLRFDSLLQRMP